MKRFSRSVSHALRGIGETWRSQRNFRLQTIAGVFIVVYGFAASFTWGEWLIVALCIGMVLSVELVNTAVERLCDFVSPGHSDDIRNSKDAMAGAVLIMSVAALAIAALVIVRHF